jgi:ribosomal protein L37AE/L43A
MTIQAAPAFVAALPDWAMLDGCFTGRISPMDIDGIVERHGLFLMLEHKGRYADAKRGQDILFRGFVKLHVGNMVLLFGAEGRDIFWIRRYSYGRIDEMPDANLAQLRKCVSEWASYAESPRGWPDWITSPERIAAVERRRAVCPVCNRSHFGVSNNGWICDACFARYPTAGGTDEAIVQNHCVDCGEGCGGARLCSPCAAAHVRRMRAA